MELMLLISLAALSLGSLWLAMRSGFRTLPSFLSGALWLALGLVLMEMDLIAMLVCVGMALYIWSRIFVS